MVEKKPYDPDVYKRLELVRKQFQSNAAERKKQQTEQNKQLSLEHRQRILNYFSLNRTRLITYVILAAILFAVIGVSVSAAMSR